MIPRLLLLITLAGPLAACGGFDIGRPAPAVVKSDPQLTTPPTELKNGSAQEAARPQ